MMICKWKTDGNVEGQASQTEMRKSTIFQDHVATLKWKTLILPWTMDISDFRVSSILLLT